MAQYFELEKSKGRALILYNFELKNLKAKLGCEVTTRAMAHYHPCLGAMFLSKVLSYLFFNTAKLLIALVG